MAAYDYWVKIIQENGDKKSADIIEHLQSIIRGYNPDDAIFDDEKNVIPMNEHLENIRDIIPFEDMPIIAVSNDEFWPEPQTKKFLERTKIIPIRQIEKPDGVGKGMIFSWEKGTML